MSGKGEDNVCNSTYGILKDRNNPCYDPVQSNNVCIAGQLYLTELAARFEGKCEILQINTDGIYVRVKSEQDIPVIQEIAKEWEERTHLELEWDIYKNGKLVQKDVNNYLLIDKDTGKYKCKGAYVKALSPIDYDLPILNKALVDYFVHDIPVEETINNCDKLIEFQKIIKLTSLYKGVVYGTGVKTKINGKDKVMVNDGVPLREKVHRVFASTREADKGIYKVKLEKGQTSYEKVSYTPEKCFIDNDDVTEKAVPDYLDRQYYIDMANERIKQFITKEEVKVDNTPTLLFECMQNANNFYEFLCNTVDKGITRKVLESYLIADCCSLYGKTGKLLEYKECFDALYQKNKFTHKVITKKISDEKILNLILSNATLTKTGKSYTDFNYEKCLLEIFNLIPDVHIDLYSILEKQVEKFNEPRYVDSTLEDDLYFVLNTRNVIAPNVILYNIKTGETTYRKIKSEAFNILELQDGDIIKIKSSELINGLMIVDKDEIGLNILEEDKSKVYDVITSYEIVYRNYNNKNAKRVSDESGGDFE